MIYELHYTIEYHSKRYNKHVTVPKGFLSDGATFAIDIQSQAWFCHDWLKGNWLGHGPRPLNCRWDDGTKCSNTQASMVLHDILNNEKRVIRAKYWGVSTYLWGETSSLWGKLMNKVF